MTQLESGSTNSSVTNDQSQRHDRKSFPLLNSQFCDQGLSGKIPGENCPASFFDFHSSNPKESIEIIWIKLEFHWSKMGYGIVNLDKFTSDVLLGHFQFSQPNKSELPRDEKYFLKIEINFILDFSVPSHGIHDLCFDSRLFVLCPFVDHQSGWGPR